MEKTGFKVPYLRAGAGEPDGSTGLCAMQVISWENGDTKITDFPECSDSFLARIVQTVNDDLADGDGFLSPENSLLVLGLGHATVGTTGHSLSEEELKRVYIECAVYAVAENQNGVKVAGVSNYSVSAAAYAASAERSSFSSARHFAASAVTLVTETFSIAEDKVKFAHEVISLFKKLTGTDTVTVAPEVTQRAVQNMQKVGV